MCEYTVERAAANLPQSSQSALFTITGGRVLLVGLLGEVTTDIQNQSNLADVKVNPSVGSDVTMLSLSNIQGHSTGTMLSEDISVAASFLNPHRVCPVGTIDLSCAASSTGQIKWLLKYEPLDPGAKVTAA